MPDPWNLPNTGTQADRHGTPPIMTWVLVAVSVVLSIAPLLGDSAGQFPTLVHWTELASPSSDAIWSGHYAGLFTSAFVHGGIWHLLFDMLWLYRLGAVLELTMNPLAYLGFVLVAAGISAGAELLAFGEQGIGMSGVVYAMAGLMWAGRARIAPWRAEMTPQTLNIFIIWGIFCVIATYTGIMRIANAAHGGGFLFGLAVGYVFVDRRYRVPWAAVIAALVAVAAIGVTWVPWSGAWTWWKGNQELDRGNYESAIQWYQKSMAQGTSAAAMNNNIRAAQERLAEQRKP